MDVDVTDSVSDIMLGDDGTRHGWASIMVVDASSPDMMPPARCDDGLFNGMRRTRIAVEDVVHALMVVAVFEPLIVRVVSAPIICAEWRLVRTVLRMA